MIYTHIAAAIIAALAAWFFQDNRYAAELAELRLEQSNAVLKATIEVRAEERAINKTYQEALNAAIKREADSRRHMDAAVRESDGLRAQLADTARRIADAPPSSVAEYTATLSGLFADCVRDYQDVAGKATGHANDVRAHRGAWPVIPTR